MFSTGISSEKNRTFLWHLIHQCNIHSANMVVLPELLYAPRITTSFLVNWMVLSMLSKPTPKVSSTFLCSSL